MDEENLKGTVARALGWSYMDDEFWEELEEEVRCRALYDLEEKDALIRQARRRRRNARRIVELEQSGVLAVQSTTPSYFRDSPYVTYPNISDAVARGSVPVDEAQTIAFSTLLAYSIASDSDVTRYRRATFGASLLNFEQFLRFVMSPVNRFLLKQEIDSLGLSPIEHTAEVVSSEVTDGVTDVRSHDRHQEFTTVDLESVMKFAEIPTMPQTIKLRLHTKDGAREVICSSNSPGVIVSYLAPVDDKLAQFDLAQITVWKGSILDELYRFADRTAKQVLAKTGVRLRAPEVVTFLSCGFLPSISTVRSQTVTSPDCDANAMPYLEISAVPWASPETLQRCFVAEQKLAIRGKRRSFSRKILSVVLFVATRMVNAAMRGEGRPTWSTLRADWNSRFSDWSYDDTAKMSNDYRRAQKKIKGYPHGGHIANMHREKHIDEEYSSLLPTMIRFSLQKCK